MSQVKTYTLQNVRVIFFMLGILFYFSAAACTVPVFRYSLERWPADLHRISISDAASKNNKDWKTEHHLNAWLEHAPADQIADIRIYYPDSDVIWYEGDATPQVLLSIADSPMRRWIARKIAGGVTCMWLLLEGSDNVENIRIKKMIKPLLDQLKKEMVLPKQTNYDDEEDGYEGVGAGSSLSQVPLKIDFVFETLSRDATDEKFLIRQIEGIDPVFADPGQPVLLAIFGRGRMIPLFAEELEPETIGDFADFLIRACSCRVKSLNPGLDMLLCANWDEALESYPDSVETKLPSGATFPMGGERSYALSASVNELVQPERASGVSAIFSKWILVVISATVVIMGILFFRYRGRDT